MVTNEGQSDILFLLFDFVSGKMKKKYIMALKYKEKEENNCESIPHDYTVSGRSWFWTYFIWEVYSTLLQILPIFNWRRLYSGSMFFSIRHSLFTFIVHFSTFNIIVSKVSLDSIWCKFRPYFIVAPVNLEVNRARTSAVFIFSVFYADATLKSADRGRSSSVLTFLLLQFSQKTKFSQYNRWHYFLNLKGKRFQVEGSPLASSLTFLFSPTTFKWGVVRFFHSIYTHLSWCCLPQS